MASVISDLQIGERVRRTRYFAVNIIIDLFVSASSYQSNLAKSCLDTILSIQPKDSSGGGGETRESVVQRLADDMLDKLPENYIAHEVSWKTAGPYHLLNKWSYGVRKS